MLHPSSLTSSFGSELLALRAVLRATINAIQSINWDDSSASSETCQRDQFQEISQHLEHLQFVGLKLSARWHTTSNLGEEQAALMELLSHKLLNLLGALSSAIEALEQCGVHRDQPPPFRQVEQAGEDFARLLRKTT